MGREPYFTSCGLMKTYHLAATHFAGICTLFMILRQSNAWNHLKCCWTLAAAFQPIHHWWKNRILLVYDPFSYNYIVLNVRMIVLYTGCPRRNLKYFGRVFLMLNYTDITQNTYIQSWTVTELMAIEKCGFLWCPRTVRRPWRDIHPLRKPGKTIASCNDLDERFISR